MAVNLRIIEAIRGELEAKADAKIRESTKRFFKEEVTVYGMKSAEVARIAGKYMKLLKSRDRNEVFELCENLFQSGYMEEFFIACEFAYSRASEFEERDFVMLERWVSNYVSNWAACDTLCNHTVEAYVEKFPQVIPELKRWAKSPNRWMRRAAAVTLIIPAKRGEFLEEAVAIADILLTDEDDLVRKGYGWLLKEESRKHQMDIFAYVMKNKAVMPRTALRYAIELMPKDLKTAAMKKDF